MSRKGILGRLRTSFLFRQGLRHVEREEYADALSCFEEVVRADPTDALAHSNVGFCNFRLGRLRAAAESYRRAVELKPDDAQYLCDLGSVLAKLGELEEAIACYSRASHQSPDFLPAFLGMGNAYRRMGGNAEALAAFKRALSIDASCIEAAVGQGLVLLEMKHPEEALQVFERLVAVQPENPVIHEGLADAYQALQRDREELAAREEAARLQPFSARAQVALGTTCIRLGQWKRAFAAFQRALRLEPELPEAKAGLAQAHRQLATISETRPETASESYPIPRSSTTDSESNLRATLSPRTEACEDEVSSKPEEIASVEEDLLPAHQEGDVLADTSVSQAPVIAQTVKTLIEQGESQYLSGNYAEALRLWMDALEREPDNPVLYNNCAAALMELGRFEEAVDACHRAMELDAKYAVARVTLCEILLRKGDRSAAEQELMRLQAIDPDLARQAEGLFEE